MNNKKDSRPAVKKTPNQGKKPVKFDFSDHNKKVSTLRGAAWKEKLTKGRYEALTNPSLLRKKRFEKGISQAELIKGTPIASLTKMGRIEKGRQSVVEDLAVRFSKKLGSPVSTLFTQDKKTKLFTARFVK